MRISIKSIALVSALLTRPLGNLPPQAQAAENQYGQWTSGNADSAPIAAPSMKAFEYSPANGFKGTDFVCGESRIPYRIFIPEGKAPIGGFPLILFFHGMGSIGHDNVQNLKLAGRLGDAEFQKAHPCYVLVPQCHEDKRWVTATWSDAKHKFQQNPTEPMALALQLLMKTLETYPIDRNRIYVGGASMGGFATWDILSRQPDLFAAAFPICGGGDLTNSQRISHVPVWVFHGARDTTVLPSSSREMVAALRASGGFPRYTEYPDVEHNSWERALAMPELFDWLFEQRLKCSGK